MNTIRIMTYQVDGCCGRDGNADPERIIEVIAEGAPDIVALQGIDYHGEVGQLGILARQLGMTSYGEQQGGHNAFLSYYPLSGLQGYALGAHGSCLRADCNIKGKRLHLFNLCIDPTPGKRFEQINRLLGPDLLGHRSLASPTLILGDFGDLFWGAGNLNLSLTLRKARRPWWAGTYPARFPLCARDRAYLRGELRIVEASVLRSSRARHAAGHLPLILTVQVTDPRKFLRTEELTPKQLEVAPG